jgi:SAM-dependent methyltransferase
MTSQRIEVPTGIYDIAEAIAPSWERRRAEIEDLARPVRQWLLRALAPAEGDTVLELAAGVGDTGFEAAAAVGESGRLICSDFSPGMLDAARRRGAERGVANVEYRLLDAERIELDSASVDQALCRFAYMLVPDVAAAFAEARRVLRPGGRLALAVWADPERNPHMTIAGLSLAQRGHIPPPEPPPAPGIFSLANPPRLAALLHDAGFADVRTEEVPVRYEMADADEYLAFVADTAGPFGLALQGLSDDQRAEVRADVEDSLGRFAAGDHYELSGVALCAVAS